ncbi:MAG TPA: hypothetical protein VLJ41_10720, partial [Segetibacter sp.]|nr:hypothetical protein [Segetibacter sp.]
ICQTDIFFYYIIYIFELLLFHITPIVGQNSSISIYCNINFSTPTVSASTFFYEYITIQQNRPQLNRQFYQLKNRLGYTKKYKSKG